MVGQQLFLLMLDFFLKNLRIELTTFRTSDKSFNILGYFTWGASAPFLRTFHFLFWATNFWIQRLEPGSNRRPQDLQGRLLTSWAIWSRNLYNVPWSFFMLSLVVGLQNSYSHLRMEPTSILRICDQPTDEQNWRKCPEIELTKSKPQRSTISSCAIWSGRYSFDYLYVVVQEQPEYWTYNIKHLNKILLFLSRDHFLSVLSGQRAADASQPAQTLRSGPHHAGQEGTSPFPWLCSCESFFYDNTGVTLNLWFWFFRVLSWTVRRDLATWLRNRRSPSWRTTWNSSPRSTSR